MLDWYMVKLSALSGSTLEQQFNGTLNITQTRGNENTRKRSLVELTVYGYFP